MKTYTLTKKQIKLFKEKATEYVYDFWHLSEWDLTFNVTEDGGSYASCAADGENCMAVIGLSSTWQGLKPTESSIGRIAFHESCELLFWELQVMANKRYVTEDQITTARHKIITTMENRIYKEIYDA